jgi:hypothetical protein
MPWHCPACSTVIPHLTLEDTPRPSAVYRCPVCRLELVLDKHTQKLTVTPLPERATGREGPPARLPFDDSGDTRLNRSRKTRGK